MQRHHVTKAIKTKNIKPNQASFESLSLPFSQSVKGKFSIQTKIRVKEMKQRNRREWKVNSRREERGNALEQKDVKKTKGKEKFKVSAVRRARRAGM